MGINLEWLAACKNMRCAIEHSQELLAKMEKPYLTDVNLLPEIHAMLKDYLSSQEQYVAIRAEIMILVYLYAPARLARQNKGGGKKNQILTKIADGIGISNSSLYVYKASLVQQYKLYKTFRDVVDEGVKMVKEKYPVQSVY